MLISCSQGSCISQPLSDFSPVMSCPSNQSGFFGQLHRFPMRHSPATRQARKRRNGAPCAALRPRLVPPAVLARRQTGRSGCRGHPPILPLQRVLVLGARSRVPFAREIHGPPRNRVRAAPSPPDSLCSPHPPLITIMSRVMHHYADHPAPSPCNTNPTHFAVVSVRTPGADGSARRYPPSLP